MEVLRRGIEPSRGDGTIGVLPQNEASLPRDHCHRTAQCPSAAPRGAALRGNAVLVAPRAPRRRCGGTAWRAAPPSQRPCRRGARDARADPPGADNARQGPRWAHGCVGVPHRRPSCIRAPDAGAGGLGVSRGSQPGREPGLGGCRHDGARRRHRRRAAEETEGGLRSAVTGRPCTIRLARFDRARTGPLLGDGRPRMAA